MSTETEELPAIQDPWTDQAPPPDRAAWWSRGRDQLRRHPYLLTAALYALVALVAVFPVWPGDPSRLPTCLCGGDKDPNQAVWFLAWTPYALLHGQSLLTTSWINQPAGIDLAQNTSMTLLGLLAAPLTLAVSPVASENLLRFLAFPLSGLAMFFVLRRFVRWTPAAFTGGLLYGFSPYMVGQGSVHLDLCFVPLPPLILYSLYELVVRQQHRAWRWGLLLGVLSVAQFFVCAEVLATTGLAGAIATLLLMIFRPTAVPRRVGHAAAGLAVAGVVVGAALAYPAYLMTHGPLHYVGPSQGINEVFNADLLGPVLPTVAELVAPRRLAAIGSNLVDGPANIDENGSYLGIPLLLLVTFLALRYWRRRWPPFLLLMAVIMFVFSLGPKLEVDGVYRRLPFRLPFSYLSRQPFLEDLLPVRLALYVVLFLAVLLALGMDAYREDLRQRAERRRARATQPRPALHRLADLGTVCSRSVGAVLVVAAVVALLPRYPYRSVVVRLPPALHPAELASIPAGGVVLTYPYATPFSDQPMLWQALDGMRFKIFGSYALRPGHEDGATPFPEELTPLDVEAMLAQPLAEVPVPGLPYLVPTEHTVVATRVVVTRTAAEAQALKGAVLRGTVENVNLATGAFSVFVPRTLDITGVVLRGNTRFTIPWRPASPLLRVIRADHVAVYGRLAAGTINPHRVADLRTFIRRHHVAAVLVQLHDVDSLEVAAWIREALGPPTRATGGADLWLSPYHPARTGYALEEGTALKSG